LLEGAVERKPSRILNVGAGTGEDISVIREFGEVYVLDSLPEALDMVPGGMSAEKRVGDVTAMDYPGEWFDVAVAFDLLEHVDNDARAVKEIHRVLRPGGTFVFTVPAFNFLFSAHDRRLGHRRRYSKGSLSSILSDFRSVKMGYWMSALFPPLAALRLLAKGERKGSFPRLPSLLNGLFYGILSVENGLIRAGVRLPVGTTIYGVCKKDK